jgi:hypothetical protein
MSHVLAQLTITIGVITNALKMISVRYNKSIFDFVFTSEMKLGLDVAALAGDDDDDDDDDDEDSFVL